MRFLWWPDGNLQSSLEEYHMCAHLQGATHSPSTANFALRKTAKDNSNVYGHEAANTLLDNFYVDDM